MLLGFLLLVLEVKSYSLLVNVWQIFGSREDEHEVARYSLFLLAVPTRAVLGKHDHHGHVDTDKSEQEEDCEDVESADDSGEEAEEAEEEDGEEDEEEIHYPSEYS